MSFLVARLPIAPQSIFWVLWGLHDRPVAARAPHTPARRPRAPPRSTRNERLAGRRAAGTPRRPVRAPPPPPPCHPPPHGPRAGGGRSARGGADRAGHLGGGEASAAGRGRGAAARARAAGGTSRGGSSGRIPRCSPAPAPRDGAQPNWSPLICWLALRGVPACEVANEAPTRDAPTPPSK